MLKAISLINLSEKAPFELPTFRANKTQSSVSFTSDRMVGEWWMVELWPNIYRIVSIYSFIRAFTLKIVITNCGKYGYVVDNKDLKD